MCGRYGFTADKDDLKERFDIDDIEIELRDSWNVSPTHVEPVVERHSPNSLHLRTWGIQPSWSKMLLINAQASKLAESKVWKKAFIESRCIIPANWFYEWKREGKEKQPYLIRLKSKELMGFAGLVVTVHDKEGKDQSGFVIVTTEPNDVMKPIHNRMPVILRKEDEDEWLNPDNSDPEILMKLINPYPSDKMEAFPVSSLVNSPQNNYQEITKPVS